MRIHSRYILYSISGVRIWFLHTTYSEGKTQRHRSTSVDFQTSEIDIYRILLWSFFFIIINFSHGCSLCHWKIYTKAHCGLSINLNRTIFSITTKMFKIKKIPCWARLNVYNFLLPEWPPRTKTYLALSCEWKASLLATNFHLFSCRHRISKYYTPTLMKSACVETLSTDWLLGIWYRNGISEIGAKARIRLKAHFKRTGKICLKCWSHFLKRILTRGMSAIINYTKKANRPFTPHSWLPEYNLAKKK